MKRFLNILLLFLLLIFTFNPAVRAEDTFKITSANFDTSNSMIVISALDGTTEPIMDSVKIVNMENPKRAYFDINSAIITMPKQDWTFNSQGIKQVKINQFSTNPNVVRVVIYFDEDYDSSDLKLIRVKNNIILKLKNNGYSEMSMFHRATFMNI